MVMNGFGKCRACLGVAGGGQLAVTVKKHNFAFFCFAWRTCIPAVLEQLVLRVRIPSTDIL
jgi:hypothetical protein